MPLAKLIGWGDERLPLALRFLGWKSRYVETSRGILHYFEVTGTGDGPPFLLIHGLGSRAADYAFLVRRLRPLTRRLILPDLPGHGWSHRETPDPDDLRAVLEEALHLLVPEPAYVLGNSLGGLIAVRVALHSPQQVRALILLSPGGAPMSETQVSELRSLFIINTFAQGRHFVGKLLAVRPRIWPLLVLGTMARLRRPSVAFLLNNVNNNHLLKPEDIRGLTMPVWLFWGNADGILDAAQLQWYREHLPPHAVVELPDGYGHSPFMDRPGHFVIRLRAFLDGLVPEVAAGAKSG